jgi:hypothetical protein
VTLRFGAKQLVLPAASPPRTLCHMIVRYLLSRTASPIDGGAATASYSFKFLYRFDVRRDSPSTLIGTSRLILLTGQRAVFPYRQIVAATTPL